MDKNKLWREALSILQVKVSIVGYDVWIKTLDPYAIAEGGNFVLLASTESAKKVVNKSYIDQILSSLTAVSPSITAVTVICENEKERYAPVIDEAQEGGADKNSSQSVGNAVTDKYTFDSFVVGTSNQLVYAAARNVAETPGSKYNPLFIYGGVGLGKTHLMYAIGNYVKKARPNYKVLYVTAETLTNELVDVIRNSQDREQNKGFRDKYRNIDLLMIDDIQHIAGKAGTQSALFNIFNDLFQNGKQIVMTSDRPPREFDNLEERLRTRFEWGLLADISAPDIETRIAILQKKAEMDKQFVPDDVLKFIASKVESNIREMEGLYHKVVFFSDLLGKPISLDTAREALKDYVDDTTYTVDMDAIIDNTCDFFRVSREDLCGKSRAKAIAEPRMICMYLISEMLGLPLVKIGDAFGGKDHSTVIHARNKIADLVKSDSKMRTEVNDLRDKILKR
ncbi:MAG: chromosomal replication initiator protein DnaA [Clostridia bacterium]|nr:chromosomal replication initiator protein DnaA [Clostridia bacterium]